MNRESFKTRFTYQKTLYFWNAIEKTLQSYVVNSVDYFAVKRDNLLFLLCYSYGLRVSEAIYLHTNDINIDEKNSQDESYGSIFINNGLSSRLIYPVYHEVIKEIETYIEMKTYLPRTSPNNYMLITTKGDALNSHYVNNRLRYYNLMVPPVNKIPSMYTFRQYYIADLLRIKDISQSFINNQIGNNYISNQIYSHLLPNFD